MLSLRCLLNAWIHKHLFHSAESLAAQFKRKPVKGVSEVLSALAVLGQAQQKNDQWRLVR